ncbi:hypothetical protein MPLA_1690026 [Mesorhizobium sp. ORS 3359]|nr:hypothetical protein MPLA_1690026 [Mesorhizobium sp. ORS 3359]
MEPLHELERVAGMHELERVAGIEPARSAWEADRLPLHHTRAAASLPRRRRFKQSAKRLH